MSHFAELDNNNVVLRVLVCDNNLPNEGYDWLIDTFGGRWVQTSYNKNFRVNFAGIGYTYDEEIDAFIPPQPYPSWTLDESMSVWNPPIPLPNDEKLYAWNEDSLSWEEILAE